MTRTGRRRAALAAVLAFASLTGACAQQVDITEAQAREITLDALHAIGLTDLVVDDEVESGTCESEPPRPGFTTTSEIAGGGTVRLCLEQATGTPIHVFDAGPGGVGPALNDQQVAGLDAFDPGTTSPVAPAAVAVAGILLAALIATLVFLFSRGDLRFGASEEQPA